MGQSGALATGIGHARSHLIVTMDGDGQNDPADIPALLQQANTIRASDVASSCSPAPHFSSCPGLTMAIVLYRHWCGVLVAR